MAWFGSTNAYAGNKGIATTLSKDYGSAGIGEDEFKFLEEDPSTSLGVKRFMRRRHKCLNDS